MDNQGTSTVIEEFLGRATQALEILAKNSTPVTKPHPLDDMSNEEIAIIMVMRGKVQTKKEIAEALGLAYGTVRNWQQLRVVMDATRRGEKLGRITRGFNNGSGEVDGFT